MRLVAALVLILGAASPATAQVWDVMDGSGHYAFGPARGLNFHGVYFVCADQVVTIHAETTGLEGELQGFRLIIDGEWFGFNGTVTPWGEALWVSARVMEADRLLRRIARADTVTLETVTGRTALTASGRRTIVRRAIDRCR